MTSFSLKPLLEIPNYSLVRDEFLHQLALSYNGQEASLRMFKNPLPGKNFVREDEIFQVLVIGGTNGIAATLKKNSEDIEILSQKHIHFVSHFRTANDLFSFVEKHLDEKTKIIGINFAFPLNSVLRNGIIDGIIADKASKGHKFDGIKNEPVGEAITKYLLRKKREVKVSVANDSICLLLSGIKKNTNINYLASAIVGTGYNMAFFLDNNTAVNIEAGGFSGFLQTQSGKVVDKKSSDPGKKIYEKEISSRHLYKHFNILLDLLSIDFHSLTSTEELDEVAVSDKTQAGQLARELIGRSASFLAVHIAGLYLFKKNPVNLTFISEGSLFWKGFKYKANVEQQAEALGIPKGVLTFKKIINSDIIGASKLLTG